MDSIEGKKKPESLLIAMTQPECAKVLPEGLCDPHTWTDEQLVSAAQDGTSSALEELLTRYRRMVYVAVRRLTESNDEAEDLVQETMLRAFLNISKFRKEARFSSWLTAIAINAALSKKRTSCHIQWAYLDAPRKDLEGQSQEWTLPDERPNPEQVYIQRELRVLLRRELRKQHSKYSAVLRACDLGGVSVDDAAQALGITRAAAKSRLCRARRQLHMTLQRYAIRSIHDAGDLPLQPARSEVAKSTYSMEVQVYRAVLNELPNGREI
jgi:RNA polymerase sigma-70 factor, ECF subfamily